MINAVRRRLFPRMRGDSGMTTSEYAMGTVVILGASRPSVT
ncbi:DUF4244 domain-containing protein [Streptomyces sp. NPDC048057]